MTENNNWTRVKLGDVVAQIKDQVNAQTCGLTYYLGGEHFNNDDLHVNGRGIIEGSTIGPAFTMRFKPGHALLMSRNPHLRKMSVADFDGICSNVTYVLQTKSELLLQNFLPFVLKTDDFWLFAEMNKRGSTNFYLNWSDFAQYEFSLPPIKYQKHIAELLWSADEICTSTRLCVDDAAILRNVLLATTQTEEYMHKHRIKYHISTIGSEFDIVNNLRKPLSQSVRSTMQGSYPYWGATGILDHINEFRVDGEYIIIGEDGDHFLKYASWDMTHLVNGKFNVNNHAHILKGAKNNLNKWFYYYYKHREIDKYLTKQGSGRYKLKKSTLTEMPILMPDLNGQIELCQMYDAVEDVIMQLNLKLEKSKASLRSLINLHVCKQEGMVNINV